MSLAPGGACRLRNACPTRKPDAPIPLAPYALRALHNPLFDPPTAPLRLEATGLGQPAEEFEMPPRPLIESKWRCVGQAAQLGREIG